jgi:UDP-N-acetylglucosamine 2-epimerase (non-hydrolysing)
MSPLIVAVVGARPNFMKVAPVARILRRHPRFRFALVHTGQHYDAMSDPFFRDLGLPRPAANLEVGSKGAAEQMGEIAVGLVPILRRLAPRLVLVAGDVNSTAASALAAHKLGIAVGHIEAGLRSHDWGMPEEVNRRLTDVMSDFCFTPSADGDANLRREGIPADRIHRVGNLMIDTLLRLKPMAARSRIRESLGLAPQGYALLTLHRPSNVDRKDDLKRFVDLLDRIAAQIPVVFPIHPRTLASARKYGVWTEKPVFTTKRPSHQDARRNTNDTSLCSFVSSCLGGKNSGLMLTEPLGYIDFLKLQMDARFVMTDSGGIQEETTVLGVPCLTLRDNTERPVTITRGTNRLAGTRPTGILRHVARLLAGDVPPKRVPPLWDGRAGERVVRVLERSL